ncbi:MAG: Obg family GTPase CgtA, partial [Peptoniphilus sp.]|nr:Obg family GTPase CgtA [Peptoniphilus sp.]
LKDFEAEFKDEYKIFSGSAATTENLNDLMKYTFTEVQKQEDSYETYDEVFVKVEKAEEPIQVYVENGEYIVEGPYIEKLVKSTNFENYESLKYFQENLRKNNVVNKLKELGVNEGDSVFILGFEFEFFE